MHGVSYVGKEMFMGVPGYKLVCKFTNSLLMLCSVNDNHDVLLEVYTAIVL